MVIKILQSFSFVYLSLSFEKNSIVIIVATLAKEEVHPAIRTPILFPTPVGYTDAPNVTQLIPTKIPNIVIYYFSLFISASFPHNNLYQFQVILNFFPERVFTVYFVSLISTCFVLFFISFGSPFKTWFDIIY